MADIISRASDESGDLSLDEDIENIPNAQRNRKKNTSRNRVKPPLRKVGSAKQEFSSRKKSALNENALNVESSCSDVSFENVESEFGPGKSKNYSSASEGKVGLNSGHVSSEEIENSPIEEPSSDDSADELVACKSQKPPAKRRKLFSKKNPAVNAISDTGKDSHKTSKSKVKLSEATNQLEEMDQEQTKSSNGQKSASQQNSSPITESVFHEEIENSPIADPSSEDSADELAKSKSKKIAVKKRKLYSKKNLDENSKPVSGENVKKAASKSNLVPDKQENITDEDSKSKGLKSRSEPNLTPVTESVFSKEIENSPIAALSCEESADEYPEKNSKKAAGRRRKLHGKKNPTASAGSVYCEDSIAVSSAKSNFSEVAVKKDVKISSKPKSLTEKNRASSPGNILCEVVINSPINDPSSDDSADEITEINSKKANIQKQKLAAKSNSARKALAASGKKLDKASKKNSNPQNNPVNSEEVGPEKSKLEEQKSEKSSAQIIESVFNEEIENSPIKDLISDDSEEEIVKKNTKKTSNTKRKPGTKTNSAGPAASKKLESTSSRNSNPQNDAVISEEVDLDKSKPEKKSGSEKSSAQTTESVFSEEIENSPIEDLISDGSADEHVKRKVKKQSAKKCKLTSKNSKVVSDKDTDEDSGSKPVSICVKNKPDEVNLLKSESKRRRSTSKKTLMSDAEIESEDDIENSPMEDPSSDDSVDEHEKKSSKKATVIKRKLFRKRDSATIDKPVSQKNSSETPCSKRKPTNLVGLGTSEKIEKSRSESCKPLSEETEISNAGSIVNEEMANIPVDDENICNSEDESMELDASEDSKGNKQKLASKENFSKENTEITSSAAVDSRSFINEQDDIIREKSKSKEQRSSKSVENTSREEMEQLPIEEAGSDDSADEHMEDSTAAKSKLKRQKNASEKNSDEATEIVPGEDSEKPSRSVRRRSKNHTSKCDSNSSEKSEAEGQKSTSNEEIGNSACGEPISRNSDSDFVEVNLDTSKVTTRRSTRNRNSTENVTVAAEIVSPNIVKESTITESGLSKKVNKQKKEVAGNSKSKKQKTATKKKSLSIEDIENNPNQEAASKSEDENIEMSPDESKSKKRKPAGKKNPKPRKKVKKQYDFLLELLEYEDIPISVKLLLQKEDALDVLTVAEIDTLFENLSETVKAAAELIFEDLNNTVALKWVKSVSLLTTSIIENMPADEPIKESVSHVASLLGILLKLDIDFAVKESITEACCQLLAKNCEFSDQIFFLTLYNLIELILSSPAKSQQFKKLVKLLYSLERVIARLQITSKSCEPLVTKLVNIAQCKDILTIKEGKALLSFLLTLDVTLLPRFHQAIKDTLPLPQTKKVHANGYGEAYYLAWLRSAENKEMRQAVENRCFQNYMSSIFTMQRNGLEMSNLGHNVFSVLSHLHNKREHLRLSKTITTLYTPLLWRYLRFENNLIRCNAAEVFFDVYPLEYHGEAKPDRIMHLDRQHQEMADLLVDKCHLVRIIALRGVFSCMKSIWTTFPPESLQKIFNIFINDCINDASSSDVRCAVYRGFTSLMENPQTHEFLASILPSLSKYLNDDCDKVRVAFVRLLQKVKDSELPDFKYWNVSDINLLTQRLASENNESVAKALTQLLFNNVFSKHHDDTVTMKRLVRLIQMNPTAGRKLIQYSSKLLSYEDALRLMMVILASLRSHVMTKMERIREKAEKEAAAEEEDELSEEFKRKLKKRRKHTRPLSERNSVDDEADHETSKSSADSSDSNLSASKISESTASKTDESSASSQVEKRTSPFDDLVVSHGLFDVVTLLWIIHSSTLNSKEKEEDLSNLYELSISMISTMLKYFKGTETFFGVLQLASLIPLSKLIPVSHIASACISQLRNYGHALPKDECRCIVNSLCSWNRGIDIIELAYEWLNEAFKMEDLNFSVFPANRANARKKKIRFEKLDVKPTCGLNLIDMIFSNPIDKKRVLLKNYHELLDLFNFMERIKALIVKRIVNEEELSSDLLSDEFLSRCLMTYLKLAIVLHKEPLTDASSTMTESLNVLEFYPDLLKWCESALADKLETGTEPIICKFINIIIQAGGTMLAINQVNKQTMAEILKVLSKCLNCGENGLLVLESAVKFLSLTMNVSLNRYSTQSLRHVYVATVPHFLECILTAATCRNYDQESVMECVQDIVGTKRIIREVLLSYIPIHAKDKTNSILPRVINVLVKAVIHSFTLEVLKHYVAVSIVKMNNLPFFTNFILSLINSRPVFCSIFLSCLNRNVSELYINNGAQLLATVSLLYTLAMNKSKFKPADFNATVKLTNDVLMKYRSSPEETNPDESALSIFDRSHNMDEQDVQTQGAQLIQTISEKIGLLM